MRVSGLGGLHNPGATMRNLSVLAFLSLAACGFTPSSGTWEISDETVTSDSCDMMGDDEEGDSEVRTVELTVAEDGAVTLDLGEDLVASCALDGKDLTCDPVVVSDTTEDTTVTMTMNIGGTFSDEGTLAGTMDQLIHCEGSYCEMAGMTEDCTAGMTFTATFVPAESTAR